ncbi:helix-turn-helix domain-containing protein, partial [Haemophilus influenzae]
MSVNEKIRKVRESKAWSQEQMAEKLNMSLNGYAKIERGETKLYLDKL